VLYSTRRVHALAIATSSDAKSNHQNTRDIHLLKHMLFIFVVFLMGWTPIYMLPMLKLNEEVTIWVSQFLRLLPVISSIIIVLDLFMYNHDLRQYLKERLLKYLHMNQN
jgi:hypothetical protein